MELLRTPTEFERVESDKHTAAFQGIEINLTVVCGLACEI